MRQPELIQLLQQGCDQLGLKISEEQQEQLFLYLELLLKWNKVYSLTAITDPEQMVIAHLLDGLSVVKFFDNAASILDVGSGMGVPGIILAIVYPDKRITLVDSNSKKTAFLQQVKIELNLINLQVICLRIENVSTELKFGIITSRAFADLSLFVKLSKHTLAGNGVFLALKSDSAQGEVQNVPAWDVEMINVNVPYLNAKRFLVKLTHK